MATKELRNLSLAEAQALDNLNSEIQTLFDNGSVKLRFWEGKVDMLDADKNPICNKTTGEVMKKVTKNITIAVDENLMKRVQKSFEVLRDSGKYVSLKLYDGKIWNAISTRFDDLRQLHTVQFTEPTVASWNDSNSDNARKAYEVLMGYKAPVTTAQPAKEESVF